MNAFLLRQIKPSISLVLLLVILGVSLSTPAGVRANGSFLVNSGADTNNPGDSVLTLREAILVDIGSLTGPFSNAEKDLLQGTCTFSGSDNNWTINSGSCGNGVPDTINFKESINLITLDYYLPWLTDAGTTIEGGSSFNVVIDANNLTSGNVFQIQDDDITIKYLNIINSLYASIDVYSGSRAVISENTLGPQYSHTSCDTARGGLVGVLVEETTSGSSGAGNGSAYIYDNLIGCQNGSGVQVYGADYVYIGVDRNGAAYSNSIGFGNALSYPNSLHGIEIAESATSDAEYNTIANNWISSNGGNGIFVNNSMFTTITANIIGLGPGGLTSAPNGWDGVEISGSGAIYNTVGGSTAADTNIIGGNSQNGVHLQDHTTHNSIQGNWIGTSSDNTGYVPNGWAGIAIQDYCEDNSIGEPSQGSITQYIKGNTREGIYISDSFDNQIGRMNYIQGNGLQGVVMVGSESFINSIKPLCVVGNGELPIDLGGEGHTANDAGDVDTGPNLLINYPEITSVSGQVVNGSTCALCQVSIYFAIGDPSKSWGGGTYLGDITANASGDWSVDLSTIMPSLTAANITLMTDNIATSEMSPRPMVYLPLVIK